MAAVAGALGSSKFMWFATKLLVLSSSDKWSLLELDSGSFTRRCFGINGSSTSHNNWSCKAGIQDLAFRKQRQLNVQTRKKLTSVYTVVLTLENTSVGPFSTHCQCSSSMSLTPSASSWNTGLLTAVLAASLASCMTDTASAWPLLACSCTPYTVSSNIGACFL